MTNDERIALLRRVAEVAPKEMGVELSEENGWVEIGWNQQARDAGHLTFDRDDQSNGTPIIAMLDAMEKAGWRCHLLGRYESFMGTAYLLDCCKRGDVLPIRETVGATRAEAVARAFVQVFGGD